ncbi:MAG: hypothetical protein K8I00_03990, partial [Candidatus Omnitrophica bacterium]|nr:hypothetical protein [Candidatus Omnitrophota bacterium]
ETMAIKKVFNGRAGKLVCSAPKATYGNLLGATGAVDLITTLLAMRYQTVPPTINLNEPDPQCDLDYCANQSRELDIQNALIINRGRGGINCVLAVQRP